MRYNVIDSCGSSVDIAEFARTVRANWFLFFLYPVVEVVFMEHGVAMGALNKAVIWFKGGLTNHANNDFVSTRTTVLGGLHVVGSTC